MDGERVFWNSGFSTVNSPFFFFFFWKKNRVKERNSYYLKCIPKTRWILESFWFKFH